MDKIHCWITSVLFLISLTLLVSSGSADTLTIQSQANIFGAGHAAPANTPSPSGGGGGVPPAEFTFLAKLNQVIVFRDVAGSVDLGNASIPNGPDGGNFGYRVGSFNGIGGIDAPVLGFLTGVFLDSNEPADPAPTPLDFNVIGTNFSSFDPQLGQVFFVGDGLSQDGTIQQFQVPPTATRLFLGLADSYYYGGPPGFYDDNTGSFSARVEFLPLLKIEIINSSQIKLRWATNSTGYQLERSGLLPTINWTVVTNAPTLLGDEFLLTVDTDGEQSYFRLHGP